MGESFLSVGTHKKLNDSVRSERVSGKRTGFSPAHHACTLHEVSYEAATDADATAPHTSPSHETQLTSLCWVTPTCERDSKQTANRKVNQATYKPTERSPRSHIKPYPSPSPSPLQPYPSPCIQAHIPAHVSRPRNTRAEHRNRASRTEPTN